MTRTETLENIAPDFPINIKSRQLRERSISKFYNEYIYSSHRSYL